MISQCKKCGRYSKKEICSICQWDMETAAQSPFLRIIDTVNFKNYPVNGGNVSKARVAMVKRRTLHPDGKGEVVLKTETGKITNRRASDY